MVAPAIQYRLYRFPNSDAAPKWSPDPALADAKGEDPEWMIWRLTCTEGLSRLTEIELVLVRYEPLPPVPPTPTKPSTIADQLHQSLDRLRQTANNIPAFDPKNAGAFATGVANTVLVGQQEYQKDKTRIQQYKDIRHDILGEADDTPFYWNSGKPIDPGDYVGTVMSVRVARTDSGGSITGGRWFTGVVSEFDDLGNMQSGYRVIRVKLVPSLWTLSLRTDCRIYQNNTALEIIDDVLSRAGLYRSGLLDGSASPANAPADRTPKREYCVQFNETDLNFVLRLLEEEGITYAFDHRLGREQLLLIDAVDATAPSVTTADGADPVPRYARYDYATGIAAANEFVWEFSPRKTITPKRATLWDYNFSGFNTAHEAVFSDDPPSAPADGTPREWPELYSYPGRLVLLPTDPAEEARYSPYSLQPQQARYVLQAAAHLDAFADVHTNVTTVSAGAIMTLSPVGADEFPDIIGVTDARYLITSVTHYGYPAASFTGPGGRPTDIPEEIRGDQDIKNEPETEYFNRVVCIPAATPVRPARKTPKPKIHGLQTAIVLGDETQNQYPNDNSAPPTNWINIDKAGRILVRFPWDRRDEDKDATARYRLARSCRVRVAQNWAGDGFGTVFIPRMGMEAVVAFEDGDPDRPVVVGCVYSRVNPMPLERAHLDYRSKPNRLEIENDWPKDDGRLQYDETKQKRPDPAHPPEFDLNLIRTRSHPSRDTTEYRHEQNHVEGYNEVSFDDQAGRERIRFHAELDFHEVVSRKQSTEVQGDQMNVVHGDQTEEVYGTQTLTVTGNRHKGIKGSEKTLVEGDRTEVVKAKETIVIKNSRTEQVYQTEQIIIGKTPEDDKLRKLTVNHNRHTMITKNDTLLVGQKEPPVPGAKTDTVYGNYGVKGATVAMNAKGKDHDGDPKSSINVDDNGNVRVEAHGSPGKFELKTHGEKRPEEKDIGLPIELSIDGRENVVLKSLSPTGGVVLECGDDDKPKAMVRLTIDGDNITMEAPKEVIFSVGPTLMRLGEQSIVFAMADTSADATEDTLSATADEDATKKQSVYYFSVKSKGEIGDPTQVPPVEDEDIKDDGPAPDASPDQHKDLPGVYIHGDSFILGADASVMIDGEKGVNVQTTKEVDGEHHLRLRSKKEKELYEAYKKAEKDRNDQIVVVNQKQLAADQAESNWHGQVQKADDVLKAIRAPDGPQEHLDAAQADLTMHQQRVKEAADDLQRKKEKYEKAKAKDNGFPNAEDTEYFAAQEGLEQEQGFLKDSQGRYDDEAKEYKKHSDELAKEMAEAGRLRDVANDAGTDLTREKDKLDKLENDLKDLKREYDRRAAYRENG